MQLSVLLVLVLSMGFAVGARRRARPPPGPRERTATIGDALDLQADDNYIGKDHQVVCTMTPGSSIRRVADRDGTLKGMRGKRGLTTYIKKRNHLPWEKPSEDPARAPFKLRFLREDPRGIAMSMVQEGKAELSIAKYQGRDFIKFELVKPKPWFQFWPN